MAIPEQPPQGAPGPAAAPPPEGAPPQGGGGGGAAEQTAEFLSVMATQFKGFGDAVSQSGLPGAEQSNQIVAQIIELIQQLGSTVGGGAPQGQQPAEQVPPEAAGNPNAQPVRGI